MLTTLSTVDLAVDLGADQDDCVITIGTEDSFLSYHPEIMLAIQRMLPHAHWDITVLTQPRGCRVEKIVLTATPKWRMADIQRIRFVCELHTYLLDCNFHPRFPRVVAEAPIPA